MMNGVGPVGPNGQPLTQQQVVQQMQHQQQQQQAPPQRSSGSSMRSGGDSGGRSTEEKYGLLGILKVIKMTDPDLNTLALGMDLTTLGLNLNSPDTLCTTFAGPYADS